MILAKASRIAAIFEPSELNSFDFLSDLNVDNFLTSYILKTYLFTDDIQPCSSPLEGAVKIYEYLQKSLAERKIEVKHSDEIFFNCVDCKPNSDRGCCKKRKLVKAIVDKILIFLEENSNELQEVDFADDVTFGVVDSYYDNVMDMTWQGIKKTIEELCHEDNQDFAPTINTEDVINTYFKLK